MELVQTNLGLNPMESGAAIGLAGEASEPDAHQLTGHRTESPGLDDPDKMAKAIFLLTAQYAVIFVILCAVCMSF
jgi:hypothetical protein